MKLSEQHALYFVIYGFLSSAIPSDVCEFESVSSTSVSHCKNLKFCVEICIRKKMRFLKSLCVYVWSMKQQIVCMHSYFDFNLMVI